MLPPRSGSSCAISMCWVIVLPLSCATANGVRLKSSYCRRKDCRHSECMPGPDITGPKSKRAASVFSFLKYSIWAGAAVAALALPFAAKATWKSPVPCSGPVQSQPASSQGTPSQPPQQPNAPASPSAAPAQQQSPAETGTYVILQDVNEVLLHATVADYKQHIVTDLDRTAF